MTDPAPRAVTLPKPADTDPSADAALHIRNLADATNTALDDVSTTICVVDTGERICDANGRILAPTLADRITVLKGFIGGAVMIWDNRGHTVNGIPDNLYIPIAPVWDRENTPDAAVLRFGCMNAPTAAWNVGRYQRFCGLAWGTKKVAADVQPAAALPPGSLFPAGVTSPWGLRYPGTDEPQHDTAADIQRLADDAGRVAGSGPPGVTMTATKGVYATNAAGVFAIDFVGTLARVRGACAIGWDTNAQYPQTRIFGFYYPRDDQPTEWTKAQFMVCNNTAGGTGGNNWPAPLKNNPGIGAMIVAWGDPPAGATREPVREVTLPPIIVGG